MQSTRLLHFVRCLCSSHQHPGRRATASRRTGARPLILSSSGMAAAECEEQHGVHCAARQEGHSRDCVTLMQRGCSEGGTTSLDAEARARGATCKSGRHRAAGSNPKIELSSSFATPAPRVFGQMARVAPEGKQIAAAASPSSESDPHSAAARHRLASLLFLFAPNSSNNTKLFLFVSRQNEGKGGR